jgi:hypothetical protein
VGRFRTPSSARRGGRHPADAIIFDGSGDFAGPRSHPHIGRYLKERDFAPLIEGARDVQNGLVPMLELVNLSNAGRLPSYFDVLRKQKALP